MIDFFNTITGNSEIYLNINFIGFILDKHKKCVPILNYINILGLYCYEKLYAYCILTILFKIYIF